MRGNNESEIDFETAPYFVLAYDSLLQTRFCDFALRELQSLNFRLFLTFKQVTTGIIIFYSTEFYIGFQ